MVAPGAGRGQATAAWPEPADPVARSPRVSMAMRTSSGVVKVPRSARGTTAGAGEGAASVVVAPAAVAPPAVSTPPPAVAAPPAVVALPPASAAEASVVSAESFAAPDALVPSPPRLAAKAIPTAVAIAAAAAAGATPPAATGRAQRGGWPRGRSGGGDGAGCAGAGRGEPAASEPAAWSRPHRATHAPARVASVAGHAASAAAIACSRLGGGPHRRPHGPPHGAQLFEASGERRVGGDPGGVGRGGFTVEHGVHDLVVGYRRHGTSVRRSPGSGWFPANASASAARPRAIRERTVPGGMPSTSPISA